MKHDESKEVFLSFKNLDDKGSPTRDSQLAGMIYEYLTNRGLGVFFSNVSLEQLGTAEYTKAIDDALDAAKVLVAIGTSKENLDSKWVRYEWDSFFNDIRSGIKPEGRLFGYLEGIEVKDLPRALRQNQIFIHNDNTLETLQNFICNALGITPKRAKTETDLRNDPLEVATQVALLDDPMTEYAFRNPGNGTIPLDKIDTLARRIHIQYCGIDPEKVNRRVLKENAQPWEYLAPSFKEAYQAHITYIGEILKSEGYTLKAVKGKKGADNSHIVFTSDQIERMAEKEHGRWNVERLRDGWRPGKKRDNENKIHECIVPWANFPDHLKQYDYDAVRSFPKLLEEAGIEIQKL